MRELLTQDTRRTPFESTDDFMRSFLRCRFNEQVNMIRLNCQHENCPTVFACHFFANPTQAFGNHADQYLLASFRYPNEGVAHLVDRVIGMLQFALFHVDRIAYVNTKSKNKRALSSPTFKRGFSRAGEL